MLYTSGKSSTTHHPTFHTEFVYSSLSHNDGNFPQRSVLVLIFNCEKKRFRVSKVVLPFGFSESHAVKIKLVGFIYQLKCSWSSVRQGSIERDSSFGGLQKIIRRDRT